MLWNAVVASIKHPERNKVSKLLECTDYFSPVLTLIGSKNPPHILEKKTVWLQRCDNSTIALEKAASRVQTACAPSGPPTRRGEALTRRTTDDEIDVFRELGSCKISDIPT